MAGRSGVDHSGTGHASRNQTVLKTTTNSENGRSQDRNGHSENVIHSENGRHRSRRGGVNPRCRPLKARHRRCIPYSSPLRRLRLFSLFASLDVTHIYHIQSTYSSGCSGSLYSHPASLYSRSQSSISPRNHLSPRGYKPRTRIMRAESCMHRRKFSPC